MSAEPRDAGVVILEALASPQQIVTLQKAKVTAVNTGPPKTVDLLIDNNRAVPGVRYLLSYASPAVNDAVYVLSYGVGKRVVIGEEA